jgi:hypothetical protein
VKRTPKSKPKRAFYPHGEGHLDSYSISAEQDILKIERIVVDAEEYLNSGRFITDRQRRVALEIAQADIMLGELEARHCLKIHILAEGQALGVSRLRNKIKLLKDKILSSP